MDLDPLAAVKVEDDTATVGLGKDEEWDPQSAVTEGDLMDTAVKDEPLDELESVIDLGGSSSSTDLDPLRLSMNEEDDKWPLITADLSDDGDTVATDMTECDFGKFKVTGQFFEWTTSSTEEDAEQLELLVLKHEELDIMDECAFESEMPDESALPAIKQEPVDELSTDQAVVMIESTDNFTKHDINTFSMKTIGPWTSSTRMNNERERKWKDTATYTGLKYMIGDLSDEIERMKANEKTVDVSTLSCSVCGYNTGNESVLLDHVMTHIKEQPIQITKFSFKCRASRELNTHLLVSTSKELFRCTECSYKCRISRKLTNNSTSHTSDEPFQCQECSFKCKTSESLNRHVLIHTSEKKFQCTECSFNCDAASALKTHMIIHSGEKPLESTEFDGKCRECRSSADHKSSIMRRHLLMNPGKMLFECPECGVECNESASLEVHMMTKHTGAQQLQLQDGSFQCTEPRTLEKRNKMYVGEKSFVLCHLCSYKSFQVDSLKTHLKTHAQESPFESQEYTSKRRTSKVVKRRMSIHTETLLQCTECSYTSSMALDLKAHMTIHADKLLLHCKLCSFKCIKVRDLNTHNKKSHRKTKSFKCKECSYCGRSAHNLRKHIVHSHGRKNRNVLSKAAVG